mgnify:CR=1 FL=1
MTQEEKKRMLKKFFKWLERKSRMASLEVPKGSLTNIDGEVRYPQMYQVTQIGSEVRYPRQHEITEIDSEVRYPQRHQVTQVGSEVRYPRFYHGTEASSEDDFYDDFPIPRRKYYRKK